jgi:hypothetical protein
VRALLNPPVAGFPACLGQPLSTGTVFSLGRHLRSIATTPAGRRAVRAALKAGPGAVEALAARHCKAGVGRLMNVVACDEMLGHARTYNPIHGALISRQMARLGMVSADDVRAARASGAPLDKALVKGLFGGIKQPMQAASQALNDTFGCEETPDSILSRLEVFIDKDESIVYPPERFSGIEDGHWIATSRNPDTYFMVSSVIGHIAPFEYGAPALLYEMAVDGFSLGISEMLHDELNTCLEQVGGDWERLHDILKTNPESLPDREVIGQADLLAEIIELEYLDTPLSRRFYSRELNRVTPPLDRGEIQKGASGLDIPSGLRAWGSSVIECWGRIRSVTGEMDAGRPYPAIGLEIAEDSAWMFGAFYLSAFPALDYMLVNDRYGDFQQMGFGIAMEGPCPRTIFTLAVDIALLDHAEERLKALPAEPCGSVRH